MNYEPLQLRERQIPHTIRCIQALMTGHCFIDTSKMGCGKTIVWCYVSLHFRIPILVISTKNAEVPWRREAQKYGIQLVDVLTFQGLRSIEGKQPKHGYLHRYDRKNDDGGNTCSFAPTEKLRQLIESGVLVVFDEIQKIKNKSDQWKACQAITDAVVRSARSRCAFLSASPYDDEKHVTNFLRLMSYIRHHRLFTHHQESGELELQGAAELIDVCRQKNPEETRATLDSYNLTPRNVEGLCYQLFIRVLKPLIVSSMPSPDIEAKLSVYNGYFNMPEDESQNLIEGIDSLSRATRYTEGEAIRGSNVNWGALTKALTKIEHSKVPLLARLGKYVLENTRQDKVILFVNFTKPLQELVQRLDRFRPLVLDGKTSTKQRKRVCDLFQSDDNYRLLIANMEVGGASLDLQDTIGNRKRWVFMSTGSYKMIDYYQATGRTHREGAKSDTEIFFVYGSCGRRETSILNALARKGKVMRDLLDEQVKDGSLFPDQYPEFVESEHPERPMQVPPTSSDIGEDIAPAIVPSPVRISPAPSPLVGRSPARSPIRPPRSLQ